MAQKLAFLVFKLSRSGLVGLRRNQDSLFAALVVLCQVSSELPRGCSRDSASRFGRKSSVAAVILGWEDGGGGAGQGVEEPRRSLSVSRSTSQTVSRSLKNLKEMRRREDPSRQTVHHQAKNKKIS